MEALIILLLAHFIGDYALQSDYIALNKGKDNYILFAHIAIWTFVITATTLLLGYSLFWYHILLVLLIPHFVADYIKAKNLLWCKKLSPKTSLYIDQSIHFIQIIVLFLILNS